MSSKLEVFRAELEALEAADGYGESHYDYLVEMVERLEAEEKAKPPAPATAPAQPAADPIRALEAEMQAMLASPERFSDAERDQAVARYNALVADSTRTDVRIDVQALAREMAVADIDPRKPPKQSDAEREALARRYDQAVHQGPERRTTEALRGELASGDLPTRMRAAAALQERGLLEDGVADALVTTYQDECKAAAAAVGDPNEYPEHMRPVVEAQQAALRAQQAPTDPVDHATKVFNDFVRAQRPPTVEQQLEALGIQAEPELLPVSTTQEG